MKNKLSKKAQHNIKLTFWMMVGVSIIAFGALLILLRNTVTNINEDPSLATLTNDTTFKIIQIINTNKNVHTENTDECWNQKNPNINCSETNKITSGTYTLHGGNDAVWLEGPQENLFNKRIFILDKDYIQDVLGGFLLADQTYYQKIIVSYPDSQNQMNVTIETQNSEKHNYTQSITLSK